MYLVNLTISRNLKPRDYQDKYLYNIVLKPKSLLHFFVEKILGGDFLVCFKWWTWQHAVKCKQKDCMPHEKKKKSSCSSTDFMAYFQARRAKWFLLIIICSVLTRSRFSFGRVNYRRCLHQRTEFKKSNKTVIISVCFIGPNLDILYSLLTKDFLWIFNFPLQKKLRGTVWF